MNSLLFNCLVRCAAGARVSGRKAVQTAQVAAAARIPQPWPYKEMTLFGQFKFRLNEDGFFYHIRSC